MTSLAPLPVLQFFSDNGELLSGGLLFTYAAGTTSKLTTYTDSTGDTPNTNPIILDSRGDCNCWLEIGVGYKFTLSPPGDTDPPTNPIWTVDNVFAPGGGPDSLSPPITGGSVQMPTQELVLINNTSGSPVFVEWSSSPYDGETHEIIDCADNAANFPITVRSSAGKIIAVLGVNGAAQIITYSAALSAYLLH